MANPMIKAAILGASGYTGADLVRLLLNHPYVTITALTGDRKAGQHISDVYPHLYGIADLPKLIRINDLDPNDVDVIFCALPHATSQEVIKTLPKDKLVIDLSADFRLWDTDLYETVYETPHKAPDLQPDAVYGLTEVYRDEVAKANLIACPGCFPTSIELPLVPLIKAGVIDPNAIIADSKCGVTGAGRSLKEGLLFSEVSDGFHAYGIGTHRHAPEIEQILTDANGGTHVPVTFTPHLLPMNRGILSTLYVETPHNAETVHQTLMTAYKDSFFVSVLPFGQTPATRHVRGSNFVKIGVAEGRVPGRVIVVSVIDNLVKGSGGQAVQNMNVRMGWTESLGLELGPMFP